MMEERGSLGLQSPGSQSLLVLVWKNRVVPLPSASLPSLTFILSNIPPAGHPAVGSVLKLECGVQEADGLDVVIVVDRRGQFQQGDVIGIHVQVLGAQKDTVYLVTVGIGLQVPERRLGSELTKLD